MITAVAIGLVVSGSAAQGARADHGHSPWYNLYWSSEGFQHRDVGYRYDDGMPGNGQRGLGDEAVRRWNDVYTPNTTYMNFYRLPGDHIGSMQFPDCYTPQPAFQNDIIGWGSLNSGPDANLAETLMCSYDNPTGPDTAYQFKILMSSEVAWDLDKPSDPGFGDIVDTQWDFLGVMMHELGHATGRATNTGHFVESDRACPVDNSNRATMCAGGLSRNEIFWRTLTGHDITAFEAVPNYD